MNTKGTLAILSEVARQRGIGRRLLIYILVFSSCATLVATCVQLYIDYQRDVGAIKTRLDEIDRGYLDSLSASLWNLDIDLLELQLNGILQLPDITAVELREASENVAFPLHILHGALNEDQVLVRDYALRYRGDEGETVIGSLKVQASLSEVYRRLWDKAVVILFSQGVKTFLVSLFILFIVHYLITRHLFQLSRFVSSYDLERPTGVVELERPAPHRPDELDHLVNAFNNMCEKLRQAYQKMHEANNALIEDNIARRRAEAEVRHLNTVLEDRVQQRTAQLTAANSELNSFCYSVSHDLRAPLRRIEGFRRILAEHYGGSVDDKGQHYLNRIEAGTREMGEMIDSFLRLSRATQGSMQLEECNLSTMVEAIFAKLRERDPARNAHLQLQPGVTARVDRRFFEMLLTNLLENAWKYTRDLPEAVIEFGAKNTQDGVEYYLGDNGVGFDMQYADRLFAPFNRLHKPEEFDGVGIGLATVQRIIARHGGSIRAEAEPGKGATFYFSLWTGNHGDAQGHHPAG